MMDAMEQTASSGVISTTNWIVTISALLIIIALDFAWAVSRRHKDTSMKEATLWSLFYVSLAILFGLNLSQWLGAQEQKEFFAGWLTEYALSVDNIFVFVIILSRLQVEKTKQQLVLLLGIIIALLLRGGFIAAGSAIIEKFSGAFFVFGAFLVFTAYRLLVEDDAEEEWKEDRFITFLRSKGATTFFIALVSLGFTDLVFALDSIPAIFGITRDPYIVVCANIFALMGLRQLYFLLQGLLQRLVYLSKGLSFILAFIGFKMFIEAFHGIGIHEIAGIKLPHVPIEVSLFVIVAALTVTAVASLTATRKDGSEIV
jgi:tellurite resistance protein TerC